VKRDITAVGAARERTSLAWRRTALAFSVNGILLLRSSEGWVQVAAVITLTAAAAIAAMSSRTFRDQETHGWFVGRKYRAAFLVLFAAAVGILDLVAITGG
jgi:uncharacterized membrane protein YidH (DUF202 family)